MKVEIKGVGFRYGSRYGGRRMYTNSRKGKKVIILSHIYIQNCIKTENLINKYYIYEISKINDKNIGERRRRC